MTKTETNDRSGFNQLYARLRSIGVANLSDQEIVALLTCSARSSAHAVTKAQRVLTQAGGTRGVFRAGIGELEALFGAMGASRITAAIEFTRRGLSIPVQEHSVITSSADVVASYGARMTSLVEEQIVLVILDGKQRPVAERVIAFGTPVACMVGTRELFSLVIREGGAALIMVHNHPSGDPRPSPEDIVFTQHIANTAQILDMTLVDHVIVARTGAYSFLDSGLLKNSQPNGSLQTTGKRQ